MNDDGWIIGGLLALLFLILGLVPLLSHRRRERERQRALDERLRVVLMTERESGPTIVGKRVKVMEGGPKAPLVPRYDDDKTD